jgi:hypothetical protein
MGLLSLESMPGFGGGLCKFRERTLSFNTLVIALISYLPADLPEGRRSVVSRKGVGNYISYIIGTHKPYGKEGKSEYLNFHLPKLLGNKYDNEKIS